jgi:lipid-binding SYLF domain-containing protein
LTGATNIGSKIGINSPIPGSLEDECLKATKILSGFVGQPSEDSFENYIPPEVIRKAKGLAIFSVVKAGFLWSGRAGSGLVLARNQDGGK